MYVMQQVSVLVKSGTYMASLATNTIILTDQEIDIIADVSDDSEVVTFMCEGAAMSDNMVHLLTVFGGCLTVTGVVLRQESMHPQRHAIYTDRSTKHFYLAVQHTSVMYNHV